MAITVDDFMSALSPQESDGDPTAENPRTGAYGEWQVMPDNWSPWAQEAGLPPDAPQTAANQERVVRHKMQQYHRQFGSWEAVAVAWFAGPDDAERYMNGDRSVLTKSDGNMTVGEYVAKVRAAMNGAGGRRPAQASRGLNEDDDNLVEDDHTDLLTSILQSMSAKIRGTVDPSETPEQRQVEQATGAFGDAGAAADAAAVGMDTAMNEAGDTDTGTRARSDVNWAPGQWGGYSNGKIPLKALAAVKGVHYSGSATHYFEPTAAKQFRAMVRAAKKDGVNITLTDSYRDYQTQVRLKDEKGGMAATPGFSNHGWGKAIDVADGRDWIRENGARYGWFLPDWAKPGGSNPEPWHFEWGGEA